MLCHALHHGKDIYDESEKYKPERFLMENGSVKEYRERGDYFGFGDGPRVCLGK